MKITLRVWRQRTAADAGRMVDYQMDDVSPDMSFLEMMDLLNEQLNRTGEDPVAFDSDCREGVCGTCSMVINGRPHGPVTATTTCQLYMRQFTDGATITIEPWRAKAFPVVRDLVVDRTAFDSIIEAGGYITVDTGSAPDANLTPVPKTVADTAFDAAACIGCGACEPACPGKVEAIYAVEDDFLGRLAIVLEECIDCGFCVPLCPVDCIHDAREEGFVEGSGGYMKIKELQAWARERA